MLKNNIQNTKTLIDFSIQNKVKNFIFISSDKAVNPKSVLGYSKNIGECLIKYKFLSKKKNNNKIYNCEIWKCNRLKRVSNPYIF